MKRLPQHIVIDYRQKLWVLQGSVLGSLLFNVSLNDFNCIHSEVCNFADDNTIFACDETFESEASNLEEDMSHAISWFKSSQMIASPSKYQIMLFGLKTNYNVVLDIRNVSFAFVSSGNSLGIIIDSRLKFDQHLA